MPDAQTPPRADLLDPATLAALGSLELVARIVVDGFLTGLHASPRRGFSVEFAEHRPYQPGDDLRYLDWRVAARSDRWLVKQYEEETNLRAFLVVDASASMDWRGAPGRLTKRAYADRVAAALALLLLRQRDAVGLVTFDAQPRTVLPPRARRQQWHRVVAALSGTEAHDRSDAAGGLLAAARLLRRPGLVILLSDLLMDAAEVHAAVTALRAAGHGVELLHLLDPAERELPAVGDATFVDPESGTEVQARSDDVREAYRDTVARQLAAHRAACAAVGAGYTVVPTDAPLVLPLRQAFGARQRLP
jgi:uncharacterized protein (DUF58 family)